jgi:hypothetical protein
MSVSARASGPKMMRPWQCSTTTRLLFEVELEPLLAGRANRKIPRTQNAS